MRLLLVACCLLFLISAGPAPPAAADESRAGSDGWIILTSVLERQYREPLDVASRLFVPGWVESRAKSMPIEGRVEAASSESAVNTIFSTQSGAVTFVPFVLSDVVNSASHVATEPEPLQYEPEPLPTPRPVIARAQAPAGQGWRWPTVSRLITDAYGVPRGRGYHGGIDIADRWKAQVSSIGPGVVEFAGNEGATYGLSVVIRHPNGWTSRYGHLSGIMVRRGDQVAAGQLIGLMGDSGYAFGTHLHLEVIVNGRTIDPLTVLPRN